MHAEVAKEKGLEQATRNESLSGAASEKTGVIVKEGGRKRGRKTGKVRKKAVSRKQSVRDGMT